MNKKITTFVSLFFLYLISAVPTYAVNPCPTNSSYGAICDYNIRTLGNVISNGITILFILATILSLFFLVFGGIKWITSGGDKTQVESARNWIVAAVVGLVITFLSYFILNFVLGLFGIDPIGGSVNIPRLVSP